GLARMAVFEAGVVALTPHPKGANRFERTGIELADLYVAEVPPGTYLYEAGLRRGDRLVRLNGEIIPAWSTFVDRLDAERDKEPHLGFISARDGRERTGTFRIRREDFVDAQGQRFARYVLPCGSWANLVEWRVR